MALGNYLASLNLAPEVQQKLVDEFAPPTAAEQAQYGVDPASIAAAQRFNAPAGPTPMAATNPTAANPAWDPAAEAKAIEEKKARDVLAAANPQGPMGSDGFPNYKDLSGGGGPMGAPAAPAMPARVVPAHWQPGTRSFSAQYGMNPDELQSGQHHRDVAAGQRLLAADKQLQAAQEQGMADAVYASAHAEASRVAAERQKALAEERARYVEGEKGKLEKLSQAANAKVDVDAAQGPIGAQIMSAIMIGLGQFGASLTGGPNTAFQIIQSGIDRRIDAQKTNIANARQNLRDRQGLLQQNLAEFGDRERAILATKVQYLDQVKALADQQYAKGKSTLNEAAYHDFVGKVNDERARAADDFAKLTHTQKAEQGNEHYVPTQVVGGAGAGQKGKDELYVPTLGGYARDAKTAQDLNKKGAIRMQINEDLRTIDGLLHEAKGLNSVTDYGRMEEIKQQIAGLKNNVLQRTTVLREQGAMSNGDKDVAEVAAQLKNVDPQFKTDGAIERARKGLKAVAVLHQRDHRLDGESNGIQLGQEQYRQGPTGPEPVRVLQGKNKTITKETQSFSDVVQPNKGVSKR